MGYIEFMLWKLLVLAMLAFVYGYIIGRWK